MLTTDLKIKMIDATNTLPSTCNKRQATNLDAMKIDDNDIYKIIEEYTEKTSLTRSLMLV